MTEANSRDQITTEDNNVIHTWVVKLADINDVILLTMKLENKLCDPPPYNPSLSTLLSVQDMVLVPCLACSQLEWTLPCQTP